MKCICKLCKGEFDDFNYMRGKDNSKYCDKCLNELEQQENEMMAEEPVWKIQRG